MKENKLVELSMDFAIKIIKLCETINRGMKSLACRNPTSSGDRTDLISSAKQISSEHCSDFIALCAISLKNPCVHDTITFKR